MLRGAFLGLAVLAMISGCVQPIYSPDKPAPKSSSAVAMPPDRVKLLVGDAKALNELIASHKGQVVFVDCWATWCGPCVEGFPHTVALAKKYRERGLTTITVSFDQLDDEPKVREFLARQEANFENVLSKHNGVNQRAANDFDVEALPQYRVYDRQGKLREKWEGKSDEIEREIERKIEDLLAAK